MLSGETSEGIILAMLKRTEIHEFWRMFPVFSYLIIGICACTQVGEPVIQTKIPQITFTPYQTPILNTVSTPQLSIQIPDQISTPTPAPTSTPFLHQVVADDTLLGIALRYGITLDELLIINPGINPNILTIGMTITIPLGEEILSPLPTPTPISLIITEPRCYPDASGGLWCLTMLTNNNELSVENISAQIDIESSAEAGHFLQRAIPPLNRLLPGQSIPLQTRFEPPISNMFHPQATLLTAIPVASENERYLDIDIQVKEKVISQNRHSAAISGSITLESQAKGQVLFWLVGVILDDGGYPIGVRKWEKAGDYKDGESIPFEIGIYSLGPPISQAYILGEARSVAEK
jgi:hypothetical protein